MGITNRDLISSFRPAKDEAKLFCLLAIVSILLCGCEAKRDSCEDRISELSGQYNGPAIALRNGQVSVALEENCTFLVSGDYGFHREIKEAWSSSTLGDEFRAVAVSVSGTISPPKSNFAPFEFHVRGKNSVSNNISVRDAEVQFQASFGKKMSEVP